MSEFPEKSKRKNKPTNRQRQIFIVVSAFLLVSLTAAALLLSYAILIPQDYGCHCPTASAIALTNAQVARFFTQTAEAARR
jgi:hypothetical protein